MSLQVYFENQRLTVLDEVKHATFLKQRISEEYGVPVSDLFVTVNGRIATETLCSGTVRINCRLVGGKGGFGSMLRAIGAQIEKTTNREACRDLSGRRLRDINEEKRLRKWLEGQSDREREAAERKQKKLERLMAEPRVDTKLNDPVYEKERQELPERVSAAVDAGWLASTSKGKSTSLKRKSADTKQKAKKSKLWIDADLSECSSSDDNDEEDHVEEKTKSTSTN